MADKHSLNYEVRELKLGTSFTNNKASQYHTIKYDFKPASVDVNKMATVDVGTNNQVTVTVPHLDGAGVPQTVFKGSQRPYTKECVLIIDRVTGEVTLEKLSSNIQVKKTRQESAQKPRPVTPVAPDYTNTTQRSTSRTRVTTNKRANPNPGPAGVQPTIPSRFNGVAPQKPPQPQSMVRSPVRPKTSPPQAAPWSGGGNSTLASLPMIGLDDALAPLAPSPGPAPQQHNGYSVPPRQPPPDRSYAERMAHDRIAPERMAPERMAPERMAPERMAPERMAPERMAPERMAPERMAPERMAPERMAPERMAPERMAHERMVPERIAPVVERPAMQERPPSHTTPPSIHAPPANHNAQNADDSSSSSSSDSGSDSDSASDSDDNESAAPQSLPNGTASNSNNPLMRDVLNDDLCLSESGSDSD